MSINALHEWYKNLPGKERPGPVCYADDEHPELWQVTVDEGFTIIPPKVSDSVRRLHVTVHKYCELSDFESLPQPAKDNLMKLMILVPITTRETVEVEGVGTVDFENWIYPQTDERES